MPIEICNMLTRPEHIPTIEVPAFETQFRNLWDQLCKATVHVSVENMYVVPYAPSLSGPAQTHAQNS